jgi:hypothetical protein
MKLDIGALYYNVWHNPSLFKAVTPNADLLHKSCTNPRLQVMLFCFQKSGSVSLMSSNVRRVAAFRSCGTVMASLIVTTTPTSTTA